MIKVEIGALVDFIKQNARFRGLIVDMREEFAHIYVVGSSILHTIHKTEVVPVRSSADFIKFSNPK